MAIDLIQLSKDLTAEGKLIEAGWMGLRAVAISPDAHPTQLSDCRMSFFAGAAHLYGSLMAIMDPGTEPTEGDLTKMRKIHDELDAFSKAYELRHGKAAGSA